MVNLRELLEILIEKNASDLHLAVGSPPQIRVDGRLLTLDMDALTPDATKKLAYSMMSEKQKQRFEENSELDMSFGIENMSRFIATSLSAGNVSVALRQIPTRSLFEELR
jgi:twitching motility protein PilT